MSRHIVLTGGGTAGHIEPMLATAVALQEAEADLQITHPSVSRRHCEIWKEGSGYRIRDLGATNRTRVNDAIVEEAELADGDRIVLGDAVLRFCRGEG